MRMDEIGYHHKHDRGFYIDRPDGAGDWLLLIVKTPSVFRVNGEERKLSSDCFVIFTPDYPQYYRGDCETYYDDWIHFEPDDAEKALMEQQQIPLNAPVPISSASDVSEIVRNMCLEHYSSNRNRKESVDLYFRLLLYKLGEIIAARSEGAESSPNLYYEKLLRIRQSIYRWPGREWSIDEMAKELSLSRSRFQHIYTETFGISVNKDLITGRLKKAADLLTGSDMSISDIASLIGYHGISYFMRQFKGAYHMTPSQYRKKHSNIDDAAVPHSQRKTDITE